MKHRHLVGLDVVRFLAATFVMMFHLGATVWLRPIPPDFEAVRFPELVPFVRHGWIGVEIFFVISGFVIAYSANGSSARDFARSRLLRLAPAAWICASLTLLASLATALRPPSDLIVLYLETLMFWPDGPWIDSVYWTLGIEVSFYGVIFTLLVLHAWHRMPLVVGAIGLVSTGFHAATFFAPSLSALGEERGMQLILLNDGCLFALGTFLWLVFTQAATRERLAMIVMLLAGCAGEVVGHGAFYTRTLGIEACAPSAAIALLLGAVGLIVATVLWNDRLVASLGRRGVSLIRTAGLMTYPLYLLHCVCGALLVRFFADAGCPRGLALIVTIAAVMLLVLVVTRLAEPRVRDLMIKFFFAGTWSRQTALGSA